jgi:hypothetical protein
MNGQILGASVPYAEPTASYIPEEQLTSSAGMAPPLVLATASPALPEPAMTPSSGASYSPMMSVLGAPPPPPVQAPSALPPPVFTPPTARAAQGAPAAAGSPGMGLPGFGDFRSTTAGVAAQAAGLARKPKLSELGTIQENLAAGREKLAKGALEEFQRQAADVLQATQQAQEAESVTAATRMELANQRAQAARMEEESAAIERERRRQIAEESASKLEAAQNELDNTKIDVEKAYGGTAGRILSAVAVAMGAFGASLTGGPNYALQIVNDRINRDIDAQRAELDKKKGKVSELGRLLQRNEDLLGNANQAASLTRAQTYRALADDVEARAKGRELTAQQGQVLAQLRAQQFAEEQKLRGSVMETAAGKALVGATERAAIARAGAAAAAQAQKDDRELRLFTAKEFAKKEAEAQYADRTPEGRSKIAEQTSKLAGTLSDKSFPSAMGSYLDIAEKVGIDPYTGEPTGKDPRGLGLVNLGIVTPEGRINRQAVDQLAEGMAKSFGGVVTESDREAARRLLRGAGTVEDIQRGVYAYGLGMSRNMQTLEAGSPEAYATLSGRMPLLQQAAQIGRQADVQRAVGTAAGFKPVQAK